MSWGSWNDVALDRRIWLGGAGKKICDDERRNFRRKIAEIFDGLSFWNVQRDDTYSGIFEEPAHRDMSVPMQPAISNGCGAEGNQGVLRRHAQK